MERAWKLEGVPPYTGGELVPELFFCGTGRGTAPSEECLMHAVKNSTAEEFLGYCALLERTHFSGVYKNENSAGIYRGYQKDTITLYTYFTANEKTVRIIRDNAGKMPAQLSCESGPEAADNTALMQFSLYYSAMLPGYSSDCGMMYVIRLRDNSLIVVDGGAPEQSTEDAVHEFMARLRALCSKSESDSITVAAWYCTHPHDDHYDFFCKLLRMYPDCLRVERLLFNFCSARAFEEDSSMALLRERLRLYCPDAPYIKLHTGESFNLRGAQFEVLATHEDLLPQKHSENEYYCGLNATSSIVKISFDGASLLLLGDAEEVNGDCLRRIYAENAPSCTFLQAAHHGINEVKNIYSYIKARFVLLPQGRYSMLKRFPDNYDLICKYYGEKNIYVAGDCTSVFYVKNGEVQTEFYPTAGYVYDGSEL